MSGIAASQPAGKQRTFLGHPIGLYFLFFTEMWERFSYYGMRALLILYMVNYFKWSQKEASTIYKVYTSFVYVTPIIGGYLADRLLGNKKAVIIGAILMAIGHFLMAFEEFPIFMSALIFLILGNGFFKPNMSTQVGRLYPPDDGRLDGAYTIFYMGINLGAFIAPLLCGWLADNTVGGYHTGFTMAGIGMVLGLVIYLLGQPMIREIAPNVASTGHHAHIPDYPALTEEPLGDTAITATAPGAVMSPAVASAPGNLETPKKLLMDKKESAALSEADAERAPAVLGLIAAIAPVSLGILGIGLMGAAPILYLLKQFDQWGAIMLGIGGVCMLLISYVCSRVRGGMRDRVLTILTLGVFVMFFWAAAEQAGNVLNIWADKATNRYLTQEPKPLSVIPEVNETAAESAGEVVRLSVWQRFATMFRLKPPPPGQKSQTWGEMLSSPFNPITTTSFQAINPIAIVLLAPLFAWLWVALDKRKLQPSIPMKMTFGLVLMSAAMVIMVAAAKSEHQRSTATFAGTQLPAGIELNDADKVCHRKDGRLEPYHAGRLTYDPKNHLFAIFGVLPDNERDRLIEATDPKAYADAVKELRKKSETIDGEKVKSVEVKLTAIPPGFDMKYAGLKKSVVRYRPDDKTLVAYQKLVDKEEKALLVAGGDPTFRDSMHALFLNSNKFVVSSWWLFWSYILTTLGELCLSPVGLSMVSKLAPAKFATMLMGVWMLTSAFGNFAAGALGEIWGTVTPIDFFWLTTLVVGGAAVVLFVLSRLVTKMMHGVK